MTARFNIRAILADPALRQQLLDLSVDFICKVEGIRKEQRNPLCIAPERQCPEGCCEPSEGR
jgi:hypothetical protein